MPIRVVRILTICLFSCLVGVFVAYKSGYFTPEKPSEKAEYLLVQPLAEEPIEPNSKIQLDISDSAFIIASSTKSAVAIDKTPLVQALKKWRSDDEKSDSTPRSIEYEQSMDDVLISSSKVITTTDKSDLALDLKTVFTKDWRRVFESITTINDSVSFQRDPRFHTPPTITLDHTKLHNLLQTKPRNMDSDLIQNNLASSSKSIVMADEADLAQDLRLIIGKGWREAFGLSENLDEDDLISQDPVSLEMVRKIDSLSFKRSMLMVSSKSMVSVNQANLADSLMNIMKKALRLRIDSLRKND